MSRRLLFLVAAVAGCSNLQEGDAGVVAIELSLPSPAVVEVGETLQLSAKPLDRDGDSVAVPVTWRTPDNTLSVDASGAVTGLVPGSGRVQAVADGLVSEFVTLTVLAPADTIIIVGDSVVSVPAGQTVSPSLTVRLESFSPAGPVSTRPVAFALTSPSPDVEPHQVELGPGVVADTLSTAADGTTSITLTRLPTTTGPLTAVVEVSASRTRGAPVPGSGQHFTVDFQ